VTKGGAADGGKKPIEPGRPGRHLQAQFLMMANYTMFALRKQAQKVVIENNSYK
jgi:hypothetical protein